MKAHTLVVRLISSKGSEWNTSVARKRFWALMYQVGYTNSEYNNNELDSFSRKYGFQFFDIELEDITQQRVLTAEFSALVEEQKQFIPGRLQKLGELIKENQFYFVVFDGDEIYQYYKDYMSCGSVQYIGEEQDDRKFDYGELSIEGHQRFFVLPSVARSSDNHWKDANGKERWKKLWLKLKHYYPVKRSTLWAIVGVFLITALLLFIILSQK
jgi:hypothetical protein